MNTTPDKIIDTATALLQTRGFNAFSYNDISALVGIKTASIHYHFPGKNDLGKSVMRKHRDAHKLALNEIDSTLDDPLKKLQAYAELFTCTLADDFKMCPCVMFTNDIRNLAEPIKNEVQGFFIDNEIWLASVLKEGLKKNTFHFDGSANECARTIFAAFEGAMLSARAFEDNKRLTKSLKQIIRMLQA